MADFRRAALGDGAGPGDGTASAASGRTAALAYALGQRTGAVIIGLILAASVELGFAAVRISMRSTSACYSA